MENNKSRKLKLASRLVGYIGFFACLIAAVVYFAIHQLGKEVAGGFQWTHIYIIAAAAGAFILIAIVLRILSNVAARRALAEEEEEVNEVEEEAAEEVIEICCEEEEAECEEDAEEETPVAEKVGVVTIIKGKLTPENKEKIVAAVKKNAPVIIAVAATATAAVVIGKAVSDSRKAKIRRNILDLLY